MIRVFDSSFITALIIPGENSPECAALCRKIKTEDEKYAPCFVSCEIADGFLNLIRQKLYTPDEVSAFFSILAAIRLTIDNEGGRDYAEKIVRLGTEYNLGASSAACLELAARKKAVLCTLDPGLREAAANYGVAVLG